MPPSTPRSRSDFKVAIICALPLEAEYVRAVFDICWDDQGKQYGKARGDMNAYTTGLVGQHNVVLVHMPGMGGVSASAVAANVVSSFSEIKLGLVVGICGAVPFTSTTKGEIVLGDVIVSTAVIQYDFGRQYSEGFQRKKEVEDILGRANREIRGIAARLAIRQNRERLRGQLEQHLSHLLTEAPKAGYPGTYKDRLYESSYIHKHQGDEPSCENCRASMGPCSKSCDELGCAIDKLVLRERLKVGEHSNADTYDNHVPFIHFGRVGSASGTVMKSSDHRDKIAKADEVIAFEMEGVGVWDELPTVVIKGACDYADSHKNKDWQEYAAATAAACMKAFLKEWVTPDQLSKDKCHEPIFHVPFDRIDGFVGRTSEMQRLIERTCSSSGGQTVSVFGLGGAGKSRLALELVYRVKSEDPGRLILWIQATDQLTYEKDIVEIGKKLKIPGVEDAKADVKTLVQQFLNDPSAGSWLLVLDSADDEMIWGRHSSADDEERPLTNSLPRTTNGSILITTRTRRVANYLAGNKVIEVDTMAPDEACEVFINGLEKPELADNRNTTLELVEKLTYLPLAIVQAASYINMSQSSIPAYVRLLDKPDQEVIKVLSQNFGDASRYLNANNPVATTWLISFEHIRKNHQLASQFLSSIACLQEKSIPMSLLPSTDSEWDSRHAIGILSGYSFLRMQTAVEDNNGSMELYDMHRLVHLSTWNWLEMHDTVDHWTKQVAKRLTDVYPYNDQRYRPLWRLYLPHAQHVISSPYFGIDELENQSLLNKVAYSLHVDGHGKKAEILALQIKETRERLLGKGDLATLASQSNLASTYQDQGRWKEAEELGVQVIETSLRVLGAEHPDTLTSQISLASTYQSQGRWKEAEELGVQVMETSLRVLGAEHPYILTSQSNLALTYQNQGRWKEAEELGVQVMETRKRVLGAEHPHTLTSQNNLAVAYQNQGRWKEAEKMGVQVMETRKRVLGAEHPDTLISQSNLAHVLKVQGLDDKAIQLMNSCWKLSVRSLGPSHPHAEKRSQTLRAWRVAEDIARLEVTNYIDGMPGAWPED